ncbi:hypothetical protein EAI_03179 [Harpegnathos saltator]|uniref:Uncharacterized protein n=1 Tax=Harpegnathos saltator TaxID=610380 RepID=E2BKS2_HARSA|nr:hypothetical protein EAI_03179 [Harpegnathos saltator]
MPDEAAGAAQPPRTPGSPQRPQPGSWGNVIMKHKLNNKTQVRDYRSRSGSKDQNYVRNATEHRIAPESWLTLRRKRSSQLLGGGLAAPETTQVPYGSSEDKGARSSEETAEPLLNHGNAVKTTIEDEIRTISLNLAGYISAASNSAECVEKWFESET